VRLRILKPTQLVSYFLELPIKSYDFSKVKAFIKHLLKPFLNQKKIFMKTC
jgi:hypothetical protein